MKELSFNERISNKRISNRIKTRLSGIAVLFLCIVMGGEMNTYAHVLPGEEGPGISLLSGAGEALIDQAVEELLARKEEPLKGQITVSTVGEPYGEILEEANPLMRAKGYELRINVVEDYLSPNEQVIRGEADASFYQHSAFLERYNRENQTGLVSAGAFFYEPMGIYAGTTKSIQAVAEGAKIGVPGNPTGYAQALFLLQAEGLLELAQDADLTAVWEDVVNNPLQLELVAMEEEELAVSLETLDFALFHPSYAIWQGISPRECLAVEDAESMAAQQLSPILVIREGGFSEGVEVLCDVLRSKELEAFLQEQYQGSILMLDEMMPDEGVNRE